MLHFSLFRFFKILLFILCLFVLLSDIIFLPFLILIFSVIQVLHPVFLHCWSPLFFHSFLFVFCFLRHLFPFSTFFQHLSLYLCLNMKSNCYVVCRTQLRGRIDSPLSKVLCSRILRSETSSVQPSISLCYSRFQSLLHLYL